MTTDLQSATKIPFAAIFFCLFRLLSLLVRRGRESGLDPSASLRAKMERKETNTQVVKVTEGQPDGGTSGTVLVAQESQE